MAGDELVGDRIQVVADVGGLRAYVEGGVSCPQYQPGLPANGTRTERVPDVAGDEANIARVGFERGRDRTVGFGRRFVTPDGFVHTEALLEQVDHAGSP